MEKRRNKKTIGFLIVGKPINLNEEWLPINNIFGANA